MSGADPDNTRVQERRSRRKLIACGVGIGLILMIVATVGPPLASRFFPGDGTGSPGNPTHTQDVAPRTK